MVDVAFSAERQEVNPCWVYQMSGEGYCFQYQSRPQRFGGCTLVVVALSVVRFRALLSVADIVRQVVVAQ